MTSLFPSFEEVIAIHDDLVEQFGGSMGLRDMGALESALLRPQMGYYDGLMEEAAAMMESLTMNHPLCGRQQASGFLHYGGIPSAKRPLHRL